MGRSDFTVCLVTDRHQTAGRELLWVVERALDGGADAIQLREKDLGGKELFVLAEKIRVLCGRYKAAFLVNDRIDVALAVDAEGVQLGKASLPLESARALLGPVKLLGASTHSVTEATEAEEAGADFVLFGPVFFTPSKAPFGAPQGVHALRQVVEKLSLPVYAIGGISPTNIREVKQTGIRGVALISAITNAQDPKHATVELLSFLR